MILAIGILFVTGSLHKNSIKITQGLENRTNFPCKSGMQWYNHRRGKLKSCRDPQVRQHLEAHEIAIGKVLMLSPPFPPLHTVHATFIAHGVPTVKPYNRPSISSRYISDSKQLGLFISRVFPCKSLVLNWFFFVRCFRSFCCCAPFYDR